MKSITSNVIILFGASLALVLALEADATEQGPFETSDELLGELGDQSGKRLEPSQVRQLLSRADPSTRLGRVSVKDLMRVDDISIKHCYKKELDERHDTCRQSIAGENVRRFCEHRHNELVAFCLARLEPIMRQNLIMVNSETRRELQFLRTALKRLADGKEMGEETVRKFQQEESLSDSFKAKVKPQCGSLVEHFESVDTILEYAGREIEDQTQNHSLLDVYELFKICQVFLRAQPIVQ